MSSDQELITEIKLPWPTVFTTVDIAVYHIGPTTTSWLLGKKPGEKGLRFPGGFRSVEDETLKHAASRELEEETSLVIPPDEMQLVGDFKIDDPRYRKTPHGIVTNLHIAQYLGEQDDVVAADDLAATEWVSGTWLHAAYHNWFNPVHYVLWEGLVQYYRDME